MFFILNYFELLFYREVNGTKFDLILIESLSYTSLLGFKEITGDPPVIALASLNPMPFSDIPQGNPIIPSYMPFPFLFYSDKMNLYERIYNLYINMYFIYIYETYLLPTQNVYLKKYFGNVKRTIRELERNISLLIISCDLSTAYPKPNQPNTVFVGPMHIDKHKPLPQVSIIIFYYII